MCINLGKTKTFSSFKFRSRCETFRLQYRTWTTSRSRSLWLRQNSDGSRNLGIRKDFERNLWKK